MELNLPENRHEQHAGRQRKCECLAALCVALALLFVISFILIWNTTYPIECDWTGTVKRLTLTPSHKVKLDISGDKNPPAMRIERGHIRYDFQGTQNSGQDHIRIKITNNSELRGSGFEATPMPGIPLEISTHAAGTMEFDISPSSETRLIFDGSDHSLKLAGSVSGQIPANGFELGSANVKVVTARQTRSKHEIAHATITRFPIDDEFPLQLNIAVQECSLQFNPTQGMGEINADVTHGRLTFEKFQPTKLTVNGKNFSDSWNSIDASLAPKSADGIVVSLIRITENGLSIRIQGDVTLSDNDQLVWELNPNVIAANWRKGTGVVYVAIAALIVAANALISICIEHLWGRFLDRHEGET